jgi:hypothetical protein
MCRHWQCVASASKSESSMAATLRQLSSATEVTKLYLPFVYKQAHCPAIGRRYSICSCSGPHTSVTSHVRFAFANCIALKHHVTICC